MMKIAIGIHKAEYDATLPEEFRWDNYLCKLTDGEIDVSCFEEGTCRVYNNEREALVGIMQAVDGIAEAPKAERKRRSNYVMALAGALQRAIRPQLEKDQLHEINMYLERIHNQRLEEANIASTEADKISRLQDSIEEIVSKNEEMDLLPWF